MDLELVEDTGSDRATATGSMHMVELPDAAAARVFAFEEPCYAAGVYSESHGAPLAQRAGTNDRGPLLSDDGRDWVGDATLIELRDRAAVEVMLAAAPFVRAGLYAHVEVHDWEFGGRR
jgi:uncharacterized protein YciI